MGKHVWSVGSIVYRDGPLEAFSVEKTCWSLLYGGNPKEDFCLGKFSFLLLFGEVLWKVVF